MAFLASERPDFSFLFSASHKDEIKGALSRTYHSIFFFSCVQVKTLRGKLYSIDGIQQQSSVEQVKDVFINAASLDLPKYDFF